MKTIVLMLLAICAWCQTAPAPDVTPTAQPTGVWDVLTDANNVAPAAFLLSNVADAKTDWHFTGPLTNREYVITPAQRLGIAGGGIFVAYTIRHYYPKTAKPINLVLAVATAYFAGRAYANTFNHAAPPGTAAAIPTSPALAFAVRLR